MQISQRNQRYLAGHVTEAEIFNLQKMYLKQSFEPTPHWICRKRV